MFLTYFYFYLGSDVAPIRNSSTAAAHWRPSLIAQTTSDCPRRMSPQTNILSFENELGNGI
jgi:hypothetical protein